MIEPLRALSNDCWIRAESPQYTNPYNWKKLSRAFVCHTTFRVPSAFGARGSDHFVCCCFLLQAAKAGFGLLRLQRSASKLDDKLSATPRSIISPFPTAKLPTRKTQQTVAQYSFYELNKRRESWITRRGSWIKRRRSWIKRRQKKHNTNKAGDV